MMQKREVTFSDDLLAVVDVKSLHFHGVNKRLSV